jgi:hypothetical protein
MAILWLKSQNFRVSGTDIQLLCNYNTSYKNILAAVREQTNEGFDVLNLFLKHPGRSPFFLIHVPHDNVEIFLVE